MTALHAQPYTPGRVKGPIRIGTENATRDGISVIEQHELADFNGPCEGLAVVNGAPFSHAMIRAQSHAIPSIILSADQAAQLSTDTEMVLDGQRGLLFSPELLEQHPPLDIKAPALFSPIESSDGERIMMRASVSNRPGVMRSLSCGTSAIGLLRMEYLGSQSRTPPGLAFFLNELGTCCDEAEPLPLIARLPDFSNDKLPNWCKSLDHSFDNDSRGTRIYDQEPFKTLIDNILEAANQCSEYYDLRLLIPYIDATEEFVQQRDLLKTRLSGMFSIGAMLETVNACKQIDSLLKEADFIALGSNDIIANLLDCPRDSAQMNPYDPAIYQLLQQTAQQAGPRTKEIQFNGQLIRMPGVLPVLIGMGYRIFSIDPLLIPYLAEEIKQTDTNRAAELAKQVCMANDDKAVKQLMTLGKR
ncbi:MAG TPA: hypothetical protein ENJ65_01515 [Candidatus Tenderia electrophaga]|uniref:PEP-utilising enzyme C-terminal domain-containing protein n=1 Tax=Candidatus Tenderia electrophaga TaxID=1748243 RepID=A0A832J485_9GAMM|nr:hypothetical protein [Candidatus Tenderia electrophaga]